MYRLLCIIGLLGILFLLCVDYTPSEDRHEVHWNKQHVHDIQTYLRELK